MVFADLNFVLTYLGHGTFRDLLHECRPKCKFLEVPRRTEKNRIESPFVITFLPSLMQLGSEFVNG